MGRAVRVFLSYRRADVAGHAGRLTDALVQRLGAKSVFHDVTAIAPGQDYTAAIDRALDGCDALLAVIGPGWLTTSTAQGDRRLFEADDYVRLELSRALSRQVRVVPVLVGGATLPVAADLPEELKGLVQRQAVVLHDENWHQDVESLVRSLRGEPAVSTNRSRGWLLAGTLAVALVTLGAATLWWGPGPGGEGESPAEPKPPCAPAEGEGWNQIRLYDEPTGERTVEDGLLRFRVRDAAWRALDGKWQVTLDTEMENATPEAQVHDDWRYSALVVGQRAFESTCWLSDPVPVGVGLIGDALIGFEVSCKPDGYIELVIEGDRIRITDTLQPAQCSATLPSPASTPASR